MKLTVAYKEIENKLKDLTKVGLSISKDSEKTLRLKYSAGIPFLPNVEALLKVTNVYSDKIELTYSCKPLMEIAIEKLLPKLISSLPENVVKIDGKIITVNLYKIEKLEKVLEHLALSDVAINDEWIEIIVEFK
ncbi:MAG: hypothetical protein IIX43_07580 [Bacteroidales bacterium]|nr:hypothetical protein [Bacteroidales bacterium]MBQ1192114.1 hypothetical protein [Bacteroidales bacterium]